MPYALALLAACTGAPPDDTDDDTAGTPLSAEAFLVELAAEHAGYMLPDIYAAVRGQVGDDPYTDCVDRAGTLRLPEDSVLEGRPVGELAVEWALRCTDLQWSFMLEIERLALETTEVSGSAEWTAEIDQHTGGHETDHDWTGSLSIDGAAAVPVSWTAFYCVGLVRLEGSVDGEAVSWWSPSHGCP